MYGLVNKAIQDLITREHGEAMWEQVRSHAGVEEEAFLSMEPYDDSLTYALVGSASELLKVPAEDLLRAFGTYWTLYTAREGYGSMLDAAGGSLEEFLENLDQLHARVALSFPQLRPPSFRLERTESELRLHYHSERDGLAPMVIGLLEGLGQRFEQPIEVEHQIARSDASDHDVFAIRMI